MFSGLSFQPLLKLNPGHSPLFLQFLFFCTIIFFSTALFLLTGYFLSIFVLHADPSSFLLFDSTMDTDSITNSLKLMQVAQEVGLFIVPPLVFAFFAGNSVTEYLKLNVVPKIILLLTGGLIMISILPFINWLAEINTGMPFPEMLKAIKSWMAEKEAEAQKIAEVFLKANTIPQLLLSIIIVAVLPAAGEELMFRGIIQRLLAKAMNINIAIIVTALLFSALHVQFLSFLPRFVLGIILGYLFYWSNNLWVPVFAHFVNNFFGVIAYYLVQNNVVRFPDNSPDSIGTAAGQGWIVLISFIVSIILLLYFKKRRKTGITSRT